MQPTTNGLTPQEYDRLKNQITGQRLRGNTGDVSPSGGYTWKDVKGDIEDIWPNFKERFEQRHNKIQENIKATRLGPVGDPLGFTELPFVRGTKGTQGLAATTRNVGMQGVGMGLDMLFGTLMDMSKILAPEEMEKNISRSVNEVAMEVGLDKAIQNYRDFKNSLDTNDQRELDSAEVGAEFVFDRLGLETLWRTGKFAKGAVNTAARGGERVGAQVVKAAPPVVRNVIRRAPDKDRATLIDDNVRALNDSIVEDKTGINNNLDKLANKNRMADGDRMTREDLLKELVEVGGIPGFKGEISDFRPFFDYVSNEGQRVGSQITRRLNQTGAAVKIDDLKADAIRALEKNPAADPDFELTKGRIDRIFENYRSQYGDILNGEAINEIRLRSNRDFSGAKGRVEKQEFEIDADLAIGRATRERIDTLVDSDSVRQANAYLSQLLRARDTAALLHNKKIMVNEYAKVLGSFSGTLAASALGFSVAGPGGLVVAALAASMGSKAVANLLRNLKFGDKNRNLVINEIRKDPLVVRQLIDEADAADKEILSRALLPAKGESSAPNIIQVGPRTARSESGLRVEPAARQSVRGKDGRFARGYTSQTESEARALRQSIEERQGESSPNRITPKEGQRGKFMPFGVVEMLRDLPRSINVRGRNLNKEMNDLINQGNLDPDVEWVFNQYKKAPSTIKRAELAKAIDVQKEL